MEFIQMGCNFGCRAQEYFDHEAFEQTGADIPIGLVVVLSAGVDLPYGFVQRLVHRRLQVIQYEVAVDILPAVILRVSREIGKLQE